MYVGFGGNEMFLLIIVLWLLMMEVMLRHMLHMV